MVLHYLHPGIGERGDPLVTATRAAIRREFGPVAEPLELHAPAPAILAAVWSTLRETVLVGVVPRRVKETVAASISRLNRCPYCVDAHASLLHATGARATARDLWHGRLEVADPRLQPFAAWAAATRNPAARARRPR
jgi:AhpD family alkylhydroperoxidase